MKNNKLNTDSLFSSAPVWSAIMTLTIPMIISSVISMVYNISDTYFVGALNDPVQNAAITLAAPAMTLFYAVTNLFGIGASSLMSRSMGRNDYETVKRASATGLYFALALAVLLSLSTLIFNGAVLHLLGTNNTTIAPTRSYLFWTVGLGAVPGIMSIMFGYLLRAEGRAVQASLGQVSGCILNILLDPFFILPWGLNLGAAGAGLATFLANCAACAYFLQLILREQNRTCVCLQPGYVSFRKSILTDILTVGIPGVFQTVLNVVSMTILNNIVAGYGANAVAAMGIANKINQLPIQIVFGLTQGVMPLIGYTYANCNYPRMKESIRKTYILTIGSLLCISALFLTAGQPIVRLFMDNDSIAENGARFLRGFGISLPFMCIDFMVVGITQAFGMGKFALIFSFVRKLALEIPFILLLNRLAAVSGIAFAQCSAEIIMAVLALTVQTVLLRSLQNPNPDR